jgi:hypothetical protein
MPIHDLPQSNARNPGPSETPGAPAPIVPTPDNGGQIAVPPKPSDLLPRNDEGKIGVGL